MIKSVNKNIANNLSERGFISAFSAITLIVILSLTFIATQFAHNTVKGLSYSRVLASIAQNQKSAPSALKSYQLGAAIANLHGLKGTKAIPGTQTLQNVEGGDVTLKMDYVSSLVPPLSIVSIENQDTTLSDLLGLSPQNHFVQLIASNEATTVYNEFDISESMIGPQSKRGMTDLLLTKFGIPLDPYRGYPDNDPRLDPFSPIETGDNGPGEPIEAEQLKLGHHLRSRLPFYFPGVRAKPRSSDYYSLDRTGFQGAEDIQPSDDKLTFCDARGFNIDRDRTQQINEPGFRTTVTVPGGEVIRIGPQDMCVTPWDIKLPFLSENELKLCTTFYVPPSAPELSGTYCTSQTGALRDMYSDFWLSYKNILESYLLEIDRYAPQVLGVFAGATPHGPATHGAGGASYTSNHILWDGTIRTGGIYSEGISVKNLSFEQFGVGILKNIAAPIGANRRLKLNLLYPYEYNSGNLNLREEYSLLKPTDEDRRAIMAGARFLDPIAPPEDRYSLRPYRLGGLNSYQLTNTFNPFVRGSNFGWPQTDVVNLLDGRESRAFIPSARIAQSPREGAHHPSWDYTIPFFNDINPETGELTGASFNPQGELKGNYALPFFKNLRPSPGGTDIRQAVLDVTERRIKELQDPTRAKNRAIFVLVTDGSPESSCNQTGLNASRPGAVCAGRTFDQDMNDIKSDLARFEQGGNTIIILLHLQHGGAIGNQAQMDRFTGLFKRGPDNPNPRGRIYLPLSNLNQGNIGAQLDRAMQLIYQLIDSYTVYRDAV